MRRAVRGAGDAVSPEPRSTCSRESLCTGEERRPSLAGEVILTPHVGSNTVEANRRMAERALQNIVLAEGRAFARMDLVNPEVLTSAHPGLQSINPSN